MPAASPVLLGLTSQVYGVFFIILSGVIAFLSIERPWSSLRVSPKTLKKWPATAKVTGQYTEFVVQILALASHNLSEEEYDCGERCAQSREGLPPSLNNLRLGCVADHVAPNGSRAAGRILHTGLCGVYG